MTKSANDVAREWVHTNDDGSGVGMTPEKIASLTALIERERLELLEDSIHLVCAKCRNDHETKVGPDGGVQHRTSIYVGGYWHYCIATALHRKLANFKQQLAASKGKG